MDKTTAQDPIKLARAYVAFGRLQEAIQVLENALKRQPKQPELLNELKSVYAIWYEVGLPSAEAMRRKLHLVVPWLLLIGYWSIFLTAYYLIGERLGMEHLMKNSSVVIFALLLLPVIGSLCAVIYLATWFMLRTWFWYLHNVVGSAAEIVERKLPRVINKVAFEPMYTEMRRRYFRPD